MRRAWLAAALVAAASAGACGAPPKSAPPAGASTAHAVGSAPDAAAPDPAEASREARLIARTLDKMTKMRGIDATRDVPGKVLPREQLILRVKAHVEREIPNEEIEREGLVLRLLGFVPERFDYGKEMFGLLEAQLAGFYEPEDATMYMAGDLDGLNAEATLAHELVHALQDQHWDLKSRSKFHPGQSDKSGALAALAEGDATSAMADFIVAKTGNGRTALDLPEELFDDQVLSSVSSGASANTPHVMRTSLVAPYVDGLRFVNTLRRRGGWDLVNKAWDQLPTTTEQILHVEKWEAHEPPLDVPAPRAVTLGPGWRSVDEDTYGEEGLRIMLEEWMPHDAAKTAVSGWGGDRATLFAAGSGSQKLALALRVRFDDARGADRDAYAARAFKELTAAWGKIEAARGSMVKDASGVCFERPSLGPLAVRRRGRDVVLVAGPISFDGAKSAAAGSCATSKAWLDEITSTP